MHPLSGNGTYHPIRDYAIIGNCRAAAMVSRYGSIDWLCLPRFDSPSVFAALLDARNGGHFSIAPARFTGAAREYIEDTVVLQTTFVTQTGACRLTDLMPVAGEEEKLRTLFPQHEILRKIECLTGEVEVSVEFAPRPSYGSASPKLKERKRWGYFYNHRGHVLVLGCGIPLTIDEDGSRATATFTMHQGDVQYFTLTYAEGEPAVLPPADAYLEDRISRSVSWWKEWTSRCTYQGWHRKEVVRSLLTLKLLSYAPSGAIVAAPTTSLPEEIGGVRNWDYRYCWLRDASFTVRVLIDLGYFTEANAFLSWILHTTRHRHPEFQVLYGLHGEHRLTERSLPYLDGYRSSRPVRVGNEAHNQLQLDIYGEVILAVHEFSRRGGKLDRAEARLVEAVGDFICRAWEKPDEGIWEVRSGRFHHTYSKAMCWVALDHLIRLHEDGVIRIPVERYRRVRRQIAEAIESQGYSESLGSYVDYFGADHVDASLLLLGISRYADARSPRMQGTIERVGRDLSVDGLLYRYRGHDDGLAGKDGAFGICSFWYIQCLALSGRTAEARERFETMLAYANDVGLFSEEFDPASGEALGNFPQAFTHIGLIDAALLLHDPDSRQIPPGGEKRSA